MPLVSFSGIFRIFKINVIIKELVLPSIAQSLENDWLKLCSYRWDNILKKSLLSKLTWFIWYLKGFDFKIVHTQCRYDAANNIINYFRSSFTTKIYACY